MPHLRNGRGYALSMDLRQTGVLNANRGVNNGKICRYREAELFRRSEHADIAAHFDARARQALGETSIGRDVESRSFIFLWMNAVGQGARIVSVREMSDVSAPG
jgi:hypothetical protein